LAIVLGRQQRHEICLWAHEPEVRHGLRSERTNSLFLPGYQIGDRVSIADELESAVHGVEIIISAMPSQYCRAVFQKLSPHIDPGVMIVSATKGLEQSTFLRMTEVIFEFTKGKCEIGALSGPSFAAEVARGDPTAIAIASSSETLMTAAQREFSDSSVRIYSNRDIVGVELAGALKNIIAIAAGICHGLGLGHNSIAALITRGLAEMTRLIVACGGSAETMAGLAGLGDLVLTCTGELSRNRSVGVELGRGGNLSEIVANMHGQVAEGIFTTDAAVHLASRHGVEMPITQQMHAILKTRKAPRHAIQELMLREFKSESGHTERRARQDSGSNRK
jgi:glycerol-3-phosphate dehydrogenase (NAD(P)+)